MTSRASEQRPASNEPRHARTLRVVDLFAGAGGLSQGFRQAGFDVVAGSDFDPDAMATYSTNFRDAAPVVGDIRDEDIRARILDAASGVDVVVGGPPCQAYSQVRNHARIIDDPRNSLYREFVRIVGEVRPRAFLMENVPGMAQMGVREQVQQDLSLEGEYLVLPQLVDAADFGVPQTRKRLLFIGVRRDLNLDPPTLAGTGVTTLIQLARRTDNPTRYLLQVREQLGVDLGAALADPFDSTAVTAHQAISDLADLAPGRREDVLEYELPEADSSYQKLMRSHDLSSSGLTNVSVPRVRADTVMRLEAIPAGGNHRDLPEELLERYLTGEKWGPHNGSGRISRRHFYAYRRLHPDIWAWTLNTKADSVYHYSAHRCLSVREFARLQSFPDHFQFTTDQRRGLIPGRMDGGAAHSKYRQVGNAVPPLLAYAAAQAMSSRLLESATGDTPSDRQSSRKRRAKHTS
ncbi:DNA cytosine methyltransferase [Micromonospora chokoriensis]